MSNQGIDWGLGQANIDRATGIRYGVISQHSIMAEALNDFDADYGEPGDLETCPECGEEHTPQQWGETTCPHCGHRWEVEFPDGAEPLGWYYDGEGYHIGSVLDSDYMVTLSPFFTFCQFCSPCVPGAGNLDHPIPDGVKTYCLGHDWFDHGKAPYPVFSVETGKEIPA